MARLDRQFAGYRAEAMKDPKTRASGRIVPFDLPANISMALSVNK